MSFKDIFHAIPEGGTLNITFTKKGDRIIAAVKRSFPSVPDLQPLTLNGTVEEFETEFSSILGDYRRATNLRAQAVKSIEKVEHTTQAKGKTSTAPKKEVDDQTDSNDTATDDDGKELKLTGDFAD